LTDATTSAGRDPAVKRSGYRRLRLRYLDQAAYDQTARAARRDLVAEPAGPGASHPAAGNGHASSYGRANP